MILKYNLNEKVFYWDALNDKICYGCIVGIEYEVCDPFNFVNYHIKNVYSHPDDDGYELEVGASNIFEDEAEIYQFLKACSYERNSCDQIRCMTKDEFNEFFAEQHGMKSISEILSEAEKLIEEQRNECPQS